MRFLLVEDNEELAKALGDRFALDGHVVDHAPSLGDAELRTRTVAYDLILLDIMLPDGDGREFLRSHRTNAESTPVIVLTARSEVSDRVGLLDLGADDYITKPFDFSELEARSRAVLRRLGGAANNSKEFGGVVFDSTAGQITFNGHSEALDEARNAVVHLAGNPVRLTLTKLAEEALRSKLHELKQRYNEGRDFPPRDEDLKGGRPIAA